MRILILGASGMLGHKLWQTLAERFEAYATIRQNTQPLARCGLSDPARLKPNVSVQDFDSITGVLADVRPEVVINCVGIVKQDSAATDPLLSISVNALFPHRLAHACRAAGSRLIHISTDCVFSGHKGNYSEADISDAEDLYGRTKYLGEVDYENAVTLRTSMIGRELKGSHGLVEWFLSQKGKSIRGFKKAIFSGFTTLALAEIIATIIDKKPMLRGVWNVAADPINKFDLLMLLKENYQLDVEIEPDETFVCDRSLNGERFWRETNSSPPSWTAMIEEMSKDFTPYRELRENYAY